MPSRICQKSYSTVPFSSVSWRRAIVQDQGFDMACFSRTSIGTRVHVPASRGRGICTRRLSSRAIDQNRTSECTLEMASISELLPLLSLPGITIECILHTSQRKGRLDAACTYSTSSAAPVDLISLMRSISCLLTVAKRLLIRPTAAPLLRVSVIS